MVLEELIFSWDGQTLSKGNNKVLIANRNEDALTSAELWISLTFAERKQNIFHGKLKLGLKNKTDFSP